MARRFAPAHTTSPIVTATGRLERIRDVASDLAKANGTATPATQAMAEFIETEIDRVLGMLKRLKPTTADL